MEAPDATFSERRTENQACWKGRMCLLESDAFRQLDCPSDSVYVLYMSQLNIHTTPDFDDALDRLRRLRKLPSKSEAVRVAVREALDREERRNRDIDYREWLGLGLAAPVSPSPKFASHHELWAERSGR